MSRLAVGDTVVRRHLLLKTRGTIIRLGVEGPDGSRRVWVKWSHPDTLPNPSLEPADDLVPVERSEGEHGDADLSIRLADDRKITSRPNRPRLS